MWVVPWLAGATVIALVVALIVFLVLIQSARKGARSTQLQITRSSSKISQGIGLQ